MPILASFNSPAALRRETEQLAALYRLQPQHSRGQNFLIQPKIYQTIVQAADIEDDDEVLEIGPGWGFLTMVLAEKASRVVSVELDQQLAEVLPSRLAIAGFNNIELINHDILKTVINRPDLQDKPELCNISLANNYKLVANLPYNITSICLRRFLAGEVERPSLIVVMVQEEVARRLTAKPGELSLLGLLAQYYSQAEYLTAVPASNFWPKPKVDSAIIRLRLIQPKLSADDEKLFWRLARLGFSARRKMLKNNLAAGLKINEASISKLLEEIGQKPTCRAQDLAVQQWIELVAILRAIVL